MKIEYDWDKIDLNLRKGVRATIQPLEYLAIFVLNVASWHFSTSRYQRTNGSMLRTFIFIHNKMCANFIMVYYTKYKLLPSIKEKVEFKQLSLLH